MANEERLNTVMTHIETHLDAWNQKLFVEETECRTSYCFAGFGIQKYGTDAQKRVLRQVVEFPLDENCQIDNPEHVVFTIAVSIFDLGIDQAHRLFDPGNSLEDLQQIVNEFTAGESE